MTHEEIAEWADSNEERIFEAVDGDSQTGFCVKCGSEADGNVEPDAERFKCETCGERAVFGAEQLVFYLTMSGDDE